MTPMKFNRGEFLNIPNYITVARIAAIPLIVVFMWLIKVPELDYPVWNASMSAMAGLVYGIASFSDILDGYIARKTGVGSVTGKFLDPLADKLLNMAVLIMLIPMGRIPAWLVVVILVREIWVTALRGIAANEHIVIAADKWGKYKNAFGSFGVGFLVLHYPFFGVQWLLVGWVLLLISVVFLIQSGINYTYRFFKEAKSRNLLRPKEAA